MVILMCAGVYTGQAQIQKGNVLVSGELANFDLGLNKGGTFNFGIVPKIGWFFRDNTAVGPYVSFNLATAKGAGTTVAYGVGAFGRQYFNDNDLNLLRHLRFFAEANVGIEGENVNNGESTNGLGLGIGPGVAYFITPNIGVEGLLKYRNIVGFGNTPSNSNLGFNLGFQIFLPRRTVRNVVEEVK